MWLLSAFADEADPNLPQQITALNLAGIRHIDLRNVDGVNIAQLPLEHARRVREQLDQAGIRVAMLGSPIGKIDIDDDFQIDVDKLNHLAHLSEVLDCRAVRIFSYYNKRAVSLDRWQLESLTRLRRLRALAGDLGLVLYHENERHIFGDRCEQVSILAHELRDGITFRLIFDFDNFNQSGDDVWENWRRLAPVTDGFHLKDSDRNHQHVPIGQGRGRVRDILADAVKRGWKGYVSLEPHLQHSASVMATGPSGQANCAYADLPATECFQIAAEAACKLLRDVAAPIV